MAHQPPAARSTLDVALWLQARSDSAGDRLSQRKLHLLLYLAQALHAADHAGDRLMPATFLAGETGPLEPNSYQLFAEGTPMIVPGKINFPAESFLHEVWARFGRQSVAEIERFVRRDGAWSVALKEGRNCEIAMGQIVALYEGSWALGSSPARQAAARSRSPGKEYWTMGGKRAAKWIPGVSGNPPARIRPEDPAAPNGQGSEIRKIIRAPKTAAARTTPANKAGRPTDPSSGSGAARCRKPNQIG
jgi:uncharacterized phage-associated protein